MVVLEVNVACLGKEHQCRLLLSWLPNFVKLGVEILYLLPIQKKGVINSKGSPYGLQDHWEWNEAWGGNEDWDQLIEFCRAHHIRLVLDWVMNHTAWDHPWLTQNPDWYEQDHSGRPIFPAGTDWHDVAQLKVNHPSVVSEMVQLMSRWMSERHIDGFRWDAMERLPLEVRTQIQQTIELAFPIVIWIGDKSTKSVNQSQVHFAERHWGGEEKGFREFGKSETHWSFLHPHDEACYGPCWMDKIKSSDNHDFYLQTALAHWSHPVISLSMFTRKYQLFNWKDSKKIDLII